MPLMVGGGLSLSTGVFIALDMEPLDAETIAGLQKNDILAFDRSAADNWSPSADRASDVFFYGSVLLPFSLLIDQSVRSNYRHVGVLLAESVVVTEGLTALTKVLVRRKRPFVYNPEVPNSKKESRTAQLSFFSGHTSTVSVFSFFTAKVYIDHHPDSKLKPLIWGVAASLPALTGYLRYKAGKHYPSDVIIGYGVGALAGILVPQLHKKKDGERRFTLTPTAGGDSFGVVLRKRF